MIKRFITAISVTDVPGEDLAGTRERLKDRFPRGATRRMTQLGMLVGAALDEMSPHPQDSVVYASAYAESRALEGYLDSFPSASPTLFQTSIHPSAVQQALIGRQHAIGEFFPLTGRAHLVAHAIETALLAPAPRVLLCGGEERGTWLLDHKIASARSFAFALALSDQPTGALAQLRLSSVSTPTPVSEYTLPEFFDALTVRHAIDCMVRPGVRLELQWL